MLTFVLTVAVVLGLGWAVINYGPQGWRTRIFQWGAIFATTFAGLTDQLAGVDWSKLVDVPKVAYGLAVGIPIVGAWLRELTAKPPGTA